MTLDELMSLILDVLPEATFGEDTVTGEIVIATGFVEKEHNKPLERIED
jgi:hypothetical protein